MCSAYYIYSLPFRRAARGSLSPGIRLKIPFFGYNFIIADPEGKLNVQTQPLVWKKNKKYENFKNVLEIFEELL